MSRQIVTSLIRISLVITSVITGYLLYERRNSSVLEQKLIQEIRRTEAERDLLYQEIATLRDREIRSLLLEVPELVAMQKKLKVVTPHSADHYKLIFQIGNKFKRVSLLEKKLLENAGVNTDEAIECFSTVSYWPSSLTDKDFEKMVEQRSVNEKFEEAALHEIKQLREAHNKN